MTAKKIARGKSSRAKFEKTIVFTKVFTVEDGRRSDFGSFRIRKVLTTESWYCQGLVFLELLEIIEHRKEVAAQAAKSAAAPEVDVRPKFVREQQRRYLDGKARFAERETLAMLRLLERITDFGALITRERWEGWPQAVRKVEFSGFLFCDDGENARIYRQPGAGSDGDLVLDVAYWGNGGGWRIRQFEPDPDIRWRAEIQGVIRSEVGRRRSLGERRSLKRRNR